MLRAEADRFESNVARIPSPIAAAAIVSTNDVCPAVDSTPGSADELILGLIPRGARVLAVGRLPAALHEALGKRLGCSVREVEHLPEAVEKSGARADWSATDMPPRAEISDSLSQHQVNCHLVVHALEHFDEPSLVLRRARSLLSEGGVLIGSVQNGTSASLRARLLGGRLESIPRRTFTRESLRDLLEASGYVVTHWLRERDELDPTRFDSAVSQVPEAVQQWLATDQEAATSRFVVRAVATDGAESLRQVRAELASATADLAATRTQLADARGELRAATERLAAVSEREADLREMLLDAHDQLLRRDDDFQVKLDEVTAWAQRASGDVAQRDSTIRDLQQQLVASQADLAASQTELASSQAALENARRTARELAATRAWRLVTVYWRARDRMKRLVRHQSTA
jgi:Methyltransferase domain